MSLASESLRHFSKNYLASLEQIRSFMGLSDEEKLETHLKFMDFIQEAFREQELQVVRILRQD